MEKRTTQVCRLKYKGEIYKMRKLKINGQKHRFELQEIKSAKED